MDVYKNTDDRQNYLSRFHTTEGIIAMENRLKNLVDLYTKNLEYPFEVRMYGFPTLKIFSKEHHEGMIDNMCQILAKENIIIEVK